jgi:hypothetical protein
LVELGLTHIEECGQLNHVEEGSLVVERIPDLIQEGKLILASIDALYPRSPMTSNDGYPRTESGPPSDICSETTSGSAEYW